MSNESTNKANPQKYKWTKKKTFNNFSDANVLRNQLVKEGSRVKVRRSGPRGTQFKVVIASEIKNTAKKEKNNAAE